LEAVWAKHRTESTAMNMINMRNAASPAFITGHPFNVSDEKRWALVSGVVVIKAIPFKVPHVRGLAAGQTGRRHLRSTPAVP